MVHRKLGLGEKVGRAKLQWHDGEILVVEGVVVVEVEVALTVCCRSFVFSFGSKETDVDVLWCRFRKLN